MVQNSSHFTRGRTVNACADLSTMPPAKCGLKANNPHMSEIPENSAFCCKNFTGQTSSPATHIDQSEFSWGLLSPFWRWGILPVSLYLSLSLCVSISLSLSLCVSISISLSVWYLGLRTFGEICKTTVGQPTKPLIYKQKNNKQSHLHLFQKSPTSNANAQKRPNP